MTDVILRMNERTWRTRFYYHRSRKRGGISGGWRKFVNDNNIEEHDVCVFEPANIGSKPIILDVSIFRVLLTTVPLRRVNLPPSSPPDIVDLSSTPDIVKVIDTSSLRAGKYICHEQKERSTRSWKFMACDRPSPPPKRPQAFPHSPQRNGRQIRPIFTIKMGVQRVLIVSDHETAKECLTINDKAFATRPSTLTIELLSYNHAMFGFAPYGDQWGDERLIKKVRKELEEVAQGWLQDHKRKRSSDSSNNNNNNNNNEDFMDVMLSMGVETEKHDVDTINKATSLGLILAASDTRTMTLTWALSLLLNNKVELKRLQQELDIYVGKDRLVEESDIKNLLYLKAIIKETLRLYLVGPLSVPHKSMEDCTVSGYHITARTRLLVNISKVHRDPRVWFDPFQVLELVVASVVQGFELKTPLGKAVDIVAEYDYQIEPQDDRH
ncbi:Cytochrome P450 82A3, putative isoform 2 [Hibiscus syriacus]|uniref:Cytochrome P450 82A3, putative isoform 2 n=1 Tax=Hibiscus syriacus TaxID=106335 RepID=A0A6A2W8H3_HIBSY|nr:Cytochrome P450 82A3, putative isoform 2 [Hibiscus syriacus]